MSVIKIEEPEVDEDVCIYLKKYGWIEVHIGAEGVVVNMYDSNDGIIDNCSAKYIEFDADRMSSEERLADTPHITHLNNDVLWELVYETTGDSVRVNSGCADFRGTLHVITGGRAPHKPESSGFIHTLNGSEYYPGVCGLKWRVVDTSAAEEAEHYAELNRGYNKDRM